MNIDSSQISGAYRTAISSQDCAVHREKGKKGSGIACKSNYPIISMPGASCILKSCVISIIHNVLSVGTSTYI
jgi:hypothetical protein